LVAWPWLGGAYLQDKNTCARTLTENVGGAYTHMRIYRTLWYVWSSLTQTYSIVQEQYNTCESSLQQRLINMAK